VRQHGRRRSHRLTIGASMRGTPDGAIPRKHIDTVACSSGKGSEQQGCLDARIKARGISNSAGRRAAAVERDHDVAIAFWAPRAHHDVGRSRGCSPVDRAHVVTGYILTQRVELCALPTMEHDRPSLEVAQLGQPAR
jgi:hypothetical protein